MAEQRYKRLTRERTPLRFSVAFASRSSLWMADDHLLLVESTSFTENYKRFFFRDIQAITVRKSPARAVWNGILGGLLAIGAIIFAADVNADGWGTGAVVLACIILGLFGLPMLINTLLGPACACQIRTAVQIEDLPSLCRVRQTHKALNKIRPLIAAAQGQLTADEVAARMRETIAQPAATQPVEQPVPGDTPPLIS